MKTENKLAEAALLEIVMDRTLDSWHEYNLSKRDLKEMEAIFLREFNSLKIGKDFMDTKDYSDESAIVFADIVQSRRMIIQLLHTIQSMVFDQNLDDLLKSQKHPDRHKMDLSEVDILEWFDITGSETIIENQRIFYKELYNKRFLNK